MHRLLLAAPLALAAFAQDGAPELQARPPSKTYTLKAGHKIPLTIIHGAGTRQASIGDTIYLETAFPVWNEGQLLIPLGSFVTGTVTGVQRPGRVKGRAEIHLRFDTLVLPNGVTRDFRGTVSSVDGNSIDSVDREEGAIRGASALGRDAGYVLMGAGAGAASGGVIGAVSGSGSAQAPADPAQDAIGATRSTVNSTLSGARTGLSAGAAAGAGAGLVAVLLTRGPEVVLAHGQTVEMSLDRELSFAENEVDFAAANLRR